MTQYSRSSSFISQNTRKSVLVKQSFYLDNQSYTIDILIIGDWNVGKTSIIRAYIDEDIDQNAKYLSTSSLTKYYKPLDGENQPKVKIFDTPGKPIYFSELNKQLKGQHFQAVVYVFDLSKKSSFKEVEQRSQQINIDSPLRKFLIGYKCDLKRAIQSKEAIEMAKRLGVYAYYESSVKVKEQLYPNNYAKNTFYEIVDDIIRALNGQDEKCELPKIIKYEQINSQLNRQPIEQQKTKQLQNSESRKSQSIRSNSIHEQQKDNIIKQQDFPFQNKKTQKDTKKQEKTNQKTKPIDQIFQSTQNTVKKQEIRSKNKGSNCFGTSCVIM